MLFRVCQLNIIRLLLSSIKVWFDNSSYDFMRMIHNKGCLNYCKKSIQKYHSFEKSLHTMIVIMQHHQLTFLRSNFTFLRSNFTIINYTAIFIQLYVKQREENQRYDEDFAENENYKKRRSEQQSYTSHGGRHNVNSPFPGQ